MNIEVSENEIFFAKIRPDAVVPSKEKEDAGYDFYACFEGDYFVIKAGQTRGVPTGIATAFSSKFYAQVEERSSMAKIGIKKSGGVIDSGYRGEWFIMTYNTNKKPFVICKKPLEEVPEKFEVDGEVFDKADVILYPITKAVAEAVMQEVPVLEEKEISYEELKNIASKRGIGGFGSSNK